jgi:hypothetical protein
MGNAQRDWVTKANGACVQDKKMGRRVVESRGIGESGKVREDGDARHEGLIGQSGWCLGGVMVRSWARRRGRRGWREGEGKRQRCKVGVDNGHSSLGSAGNDSAGARWRNDERPDKPNGHECMSSRTYSHSIQSSLLAQSSC